MADLCKQGHLLIPSNILLDFNRGSVTIRCRECRRLSAERVSRKRGVLKRGTAEYKIALFEKHFTKGSGCWLWTGTKEVKGYGRFGIPGTTGLAMAHRYSYELYVGPIPEGLQLDHKCENKDCVNPEHLQPVTNDENQKLYWQRLREKRKVCYQQ